MSDIIEAEKPVEWRPVVGFADYSVSAGGKIMRTARDMRGRLSGQPLKPSRDKDGYLRVHLFSRGSKRTLKVHRVVCEAFHGPRPEGKHDVAHGDGDHLNNAAANLRWATQKENAADRDLHNRTARGDRHPSKTRPGYLPTGDGHWTRLNPAARTKGERHGSARLKENDVRSIRRDPRKNIEIAAAFGVTPTTIGHIKSLKTWCHVA